MPVIQLVINGNIQAWINAKNLNLNEAKVEAKPQKLYIFKSGDILYRWKQKEKGGMIWLIEDKSMSEFDYNNGFRSIAEEGPLYQGNERPVKVISYD